MSLFPAPLATVDTPGFSSLGTVKAPLTSDVEYWVDSATGSDSNAGTQLAPWLTLQRALDEVHKYGELHAQFLAHLVGVGPYTTPQISDLYVGQDGRFELRGDDAARVTLATGTFTGPFDSATCVAPTSAGLGADTYGGRFLRVTSGTLNGAEFSIVEHTDASITIGVYRAVADIGNVVNGDTFEIFTPGTQIAFQTVVGQSRLPGIYDIQGGCPLTIQSLQGPNAWLRLLRLTGSANQICNAVLGMSAVQSDNPLQFTGPKTQVYAACADATQFDATLPTHALYGVGLYVSTAGIGWLDQGATFMGTYTTVLTASTVQGLLVGPNNPANLQLFAMRGNTVRCFQGRTSFYSGSSSARMVSVLNFLQADYTSEIYVYLYAIVRCFPSAANTTCYEARDSSRMICEGRTLGTGTGTGYGYAINGSGSIQFRGANSPEAVGAVAGSDVATPNIAAVALATFAAAGSGIVDPNTGGSVYRT